MPRKEKILLVEDYDDVRLMTRIMLEGMGFEVVEAADGYEAYNQAILNHPDAVLMDIAMPGLNGITAAALIHQLDDCSNTPIIAVTAYGNEYFGRAADFGFDAVLRKPVDMDELENVLRSHLPDSPSTSAAA